MRIFLLISVFFLLNACGSAIDAAKRARTQSILINTPHADGSKCVLTDGIGRKWYVTKTPNTVNVEDGHSPLHVVCRKKGYKNTTTTINERKQELLTIDGERVTVGLYQQFPTKAPRLVPTVLKESASIFLDPTGNYSTEYPREITVWMEPERFKSEEAMIAWAYDKEIWINERLLQEADDREKDDARKSVRRELKHARKEKRKELWDKSVAFAKNAFDKGTKPITYVKAAEKAAKYATKHTEEAVRYAAGVSEVGGAYAMDAAEESAKYSTDVAGKAAVRTTNLARDVSTHAVATAGKTAGGVLKELSFDEQLKELGEKGLKYQDEWMKKYGSTISPEQRKRLEKTTWFPNWFKYSASKQSKVGNTQRKQDMEQPASEIERVIKQMEERKKKEGDVPPWIEERKEQ